TSSLSGGQATLFTGSLTNIALPPNQTLVIIGGAGEVPPAYASLWGRITSSAAVTISTVFDYRSVKPDQLFGRTGVGASDTDMKQFVIPRARNTTTKLDTGFAIVNTGTASANLV